MVIRPSIMLFRHRTTQADFEREVMPHLQALYGVAMRMTKSEGDAEDLVQDTILRAYRFWDGFEAGSNCRAWLMRILTNVFRNRYRERLREQEILGEAETCKANLGQFQGAAPRDAESALFGRMLSRDVEKALETLPLEFRLPVILADLEDLSYKEIADIMECPAGTVMSRLYRGRKMLQKQLSEYAVQTESEIEPTTKQATATLVDFVSFRRKKQEGGAV
jgi:RNA polymerase sigma-70 factor (ECF subfamily)